MLRIELSGQKINKAARNREVQELTGRSHASVEKKHQNISAVMIELGLPYIDGYKPLGNYQTKLYEIAASMVADDPGLLAAVHDQVSAQASVPSFDEILNALVAAPSREKPLKQVYTAENRPPMKRVHFDYLAIESQNRSLGEAGEHFVLDYERAYLMATRRDDLAKRVKHLPSIHGDGAGYDILSFDEQGKEKWIEVKTTRYGAFTPFYISPNEVAVSERDSDKFHLYRLYHFHKAPKFFDLSGSVSIHCDLRSVNYIGTLR